MLVWQFFETEHTSFPAFTSTCMHRYGRRQVATLHLNFRYTKVAVADTMTFTDF